MESQCASNELSFFRKNNKYIPEKLVPFFNIESAPPTQVELDKFREGIETTILNLASANYLRYAGISILLVAGYFVYRESGEGNDSLSVWLLLSALIVIGALAMIFSSILKNEVLLDKYNILYMLKPVDPDDCDRLAVALEKTKCAQVLKYRDSVIAQKRDFCNAEYIAIEEALISYNAEQDQVFKRARLYEPDVYQKAILEQAAKGNKE